MRERQEDITSAVLLSEKNELTDDSRNLGQSPKNRSTSDGKTRKMSPMWKCICDEGARGATGKMNQNKRKNGNEIVNKE